MRGKKGVNLMSLLTPIHTARELLSTLSSIHQSFQHVCQMATEKQNDALAFCVNACALCLFTTIRGNPITGVSLLVTSLGALLIEKKIYTLAVSCFDSIGLFKKSGEAPPPVEPKAVATPLLSPTNQSKEKIEEERWEELRQSIEEAEDATTKLQPPSKSRQQHEKELKDLEELVNEECLPGGFFYTG